MEHHDELGGRHLALVVEEGTREHLEEHPAGLGREAHRVEVLGCGRCVEAPVGLLRVELQHLARGGTVHRPQRPPVEARRAPDQGDQVERRPRGQPCEGLPRTVRPEEGIVGDRAQPAQARVDAP